MSHLEDLLVLRQGEPHHFDPEVWDFAEDIEIRKSGVSRLANLTAGALQGRLDAIELNIQYLDDGGPVDPAKTAFSGWTSPWWWYRTRQGTLAEFHRRGLTPSPSPGIPVKPAIAPEFRGRLSGGGELLVRLSRRDYLLALLKEGRMRFAPAASYDDSSLDAARADDEMAKTYHRPGQVLVMTTEDGQRIEPIGDVAFTRQRRVEDVSGGLIDTPYWMLSFSSELDPRLLDAFDSADPDEDGFLVVWDVAGFFHRALPHILKVAPETRVSTVQNTYFDPYYPPREGLQAIKSKSMAYAYQREVRFVVDPEGFPVTLAADGCLYPTMDSIEDIAGVYGRDGRKIAGAGPDSFLA